MPAKINEFAAIAARIMLLASLAAQAGCGGSGEEPQPRPVPLPPPNTPPPPPPPPDDLTAKVQAAQEGILADTCFRLGGGNCVWTERPYQPGEFVMPASDEAILVVDDFPSLPVRAIRFRKRIKGVHKIGAGGRMTEPSMTWRIPAALWTALDMFSGPNHIPTQRLAPLAGAIETSYKSVQFDTIGHGSFVFSLIADTNPHQPLVLLDHIDLPEMARTDYCETTGSAVSQDSLRLVAEQAAREIKSLIQLNNVRFINYSGGHTLGTVKASWQKDCGTPVPSDAVLRMKLGAYAPIYAALFAAPGVLAAHAAIEAGGSSDAPYDQKATYPNRRRVGYFTSLNSGLNDDGTGGTGPFEAWPSLERTDIYFNTGVLPVRPFQYNDTPLLQIDEFGVSLYPIGAPTTSWVTPLALSRFINIRQSQFGARQMDDALVGEIFQIAAPARCPASPEGRCIYQDPLLHGQVEAVRLGYRNRRYP